MRLLLLLGLCFLTSHAQSVAVKGVFKSTRLINISSTEQLYARTMEYRIGHRFGDANSGIKEFFGLDLGANTLLGFDFGVTDDIKLGFSRANRGKNYGFNGQYRIMRQRRDDSMPLTLSFLASTNYLSQELNKEAYYSAELLISRKFSSDLSLQLSPFFIQSAESEDLGTSLHAAYGIGVSGRYKFTTHTSLMFEWTPLFNRDDYNDKSHFSRQYDHDAFSLAYNIEAAGHTFQIIATNTQEASMITSKLGSNHKAFSKHFYLGFNITRLFLLYDEEL